MWGWSMGYDYDDDLSCDEYLKHIENIKTAVFSGIVKNSSLRILFPHYDEYHLIPKLRTIFLAYKYAPLFMMSNYSYAKEISDELFILTNSYNPDEIRESFFKLHNINLNYENLIENLFDVIEEKYKYDYANKFSQHYYPNGKFVDKNGKEYDNVVDITDKDFFLFAHNISIGFASRDNANMLTLRPDLFVDEDWGNSNTISGAVITKNFLGYAYSFDGYENQEIVYGFNCLTKDDIIVMGNKDLGTSHNVLTDKEKPGYHLIALYDTDNLSKNMINEYGEGIIWRKTQGKKRSPDYILCIDEISENAQIHAKAYNIPIYYIDRMKCLKTQSRKLFEEFESLKNDDVKTLGKIENYLLELISFHWSIALLQYSFDYLNEDVQRLIRNLKDLYTESGEFIDYYLCDLKLLDNFQRSNKVEWITIDNLIKRNNATSSAMDGFFDIMTDTIARSTYSLE